MPGTVLSSEDTQREQNRQKNPALVMLKDNKQQKDHKMCSMLKGDKFYRKKKNKTTKGKREQGGITAKRMVKKVDTCVNI